MREIAVEDLIPTPDNTRFEPPAAEIASLAESIAAVGQLQPGVARPHPTKAGKYDLRAGYRRWLACTKLGRPMLVIVRELTDGQAREITVTENLQREDLHPLEESAAIAKLMEGGERVEDVAARLGRTPEWVARRAKLRELIWEFVKEIRAAEPGSDWAKIGVGVLERLAALPAETQRKLWGDAAPRQGRHATYPPWFLEDGLREFDAYLHREVYLSLDRVPWKLDEEGVADRPACAACPKRTGAEPLLFDDGGKKAADRCLDQGCHRAKSQAVLAAREEKLRAKHPELIKLDKATPAYGTGRQREETRKVFGADVKFSGDVFSARKKDAGAVPALVVAGPGVGQIEWVKPWATSVKGGGAKTKAGPKSLKEKRAALEDRRMGWVVDQVAKRLEALSDEYEGLPQPDYGELPCLLAAFGTEPFRGSWNRGGSRQEWKEAEALPSCAAAFGTLWSKLFAVWESRLSHHNLHAIKTLFEDAERMAGYAEIDFEALVTEAVDAIPEPKSWAKEGAKTRSTKAKKATKPKPAKKKAAKRPRKAVTA